MALAKYSEVVVKAICDAIAVTGMDEPGWKAGGVTRETFYRWKREKTDFLQQVEAAHSEYHRVTTNALRRTANKALLDYLTGSMMRVESTTIEHPDGNVTETTKRIPVGIPRWAIDRCLPTQMIEVEAIVTLAEQKILPQWVATYAQSILDEARAKIAEAVRGELPETEIQQWIERQQQSDTERSGVTDETWAGIRSQVMGIKDQEKPKPESTSSFQNTSKPA